MRGLATSFGRISYSLVADESSVRASIRVPEREPLGSLRLRLRLPEGRRIQEVLVDGAPSAGLQRDGETIVLPTQGGLLEVEALVG